MIAESYRWKVNDGTVIEVVESSSSSAGDQQPPQQDPARMMTASAKSKPKRVPLPTDKEHPSNLFKQDSEVIAGKTVLIGFAQEVGKMMQNQIFKALNDRVNKGQVGGETGLVSYSIEMTKN